MQLLIGWFAGLSEVVQQRVANRLYLIGNLIRFLLCDILSLRQKCHKRGTVKLLEAIT